MSIQIHKVIRSKRRTIGLQITPDATLVIRAPYRVGLGFIEKIVWEKRHWIKKKLESAAARQTQVRTKNFITGEKFLFLGENFDLKIVHGLKNSFIFTGGEFLLSAKASRAGKHLFTLWYKKRAFQKIQERVDFFAKKIGTKYSRLRISDAERRWGSCGAKNSLNFSWKLIMAPLAVVDYVIIHELTHIQHKNHSRKFWLGVQAVMPEYKKHEHWLKNHGHILTL